MVIALNPGVQTAAQPQKDPITVNQLGLTWVKVGWRSADTQVQVGEGFCPLDLLCQNSYHRGSLQEVARLYIVGIQQLKECTGEWLMCMSQLFMRGPYMSSKIVKVEEQVRL